MVSSVASLALQRVGNRVHPSRSLHTLGKNLIVCQADRQQQGGENASPSVPPPPPTARQPPPGARPPMPGGPVILGENGQPLKAQRLNEDLFSGVAAVDRGETPDDLGRVALLVAGDAAALLAFATVGRVSHGEALSLGASLSTAAPFLAGWYAAALGTGAFGKDAQGGNAGKAALLAAKTWAVGIPLGLAFRSVAKGYLPETTFLLVSMAATGVFLVGWRTALAAATPATPEPQTPREQLAARRNRRGGPFEFIEMIMSMTRRW